MSTFLQPVSPVMGAGETVSTVTLTPTVPIGTEWSDTAGNKYLYVYNACNSQLSQGQYCVLATNVSGYSVSITNVSGMGIAVGMVRNATFATLAYGWLMTKGFAGIATDTASFVTNQILALGQNGAFQALTTVAGSFVTATPMGMALAPIPSQTTCSTAANLNSAWINIQ